MKPPTTAAFVPPAKWKTAYRTLLALRDALQAERAERSSAFRAPLEKGGVDRGDTSAVIGEAEVLLAEIGHEQAALTEVEAALDRIRRGTYGVCEATGKPISDARLRALPWTRLCAAAAKKLEPAK
jgi:RNA polymerase-binding transcription factor DksA